MRLQQGARGKTETREFGTPTTELLRLHAWLSEAGCTHVAMESTSVYWKPIFNVLEASFEVVLANAYHFKAVPGRMTDVKDCAWIAALLAHGLIGASFIPPAAIRELRDLGGHSLDQGAWFAGATTRRAPCTKRVVQPPHAPRVALDHNPTARRASAEFAFRVERRTGPVDGSTSATTPRHPRGTLNPRLSPSHPRASVPATDRESSSQSRSKCEPFGMDPMA